MPEPRPQDMDPEKPNWITDKKTFRALAHPTRWQILQQFDLEPTMTATRCSELTGESVASCSYHLNTLSRYGFVEAAEGGTGREKPWRLVVVDRSWRAGGEGLDDEAAVAAVALSDVSLDHLAAHLKSWIRWRSREEPQWLDATAVTETVAFVTADELAELTADIRTLVHRYNDRVGDPSARPAGARAAQVFAATSLRRPPEVDRGDR
ncbi:winged helix-turn-helix domain-containing protein [Pseudonocardia sediminis]|uniref:winged helix-turn-helix domain-containing protein n=1 Tax=Pseudonocardia sediminis TaxID=1397368 RepID=UPI0013EF3036|nr:helix-turn-helix domain-containing protein [Pseudonocardia sediminis]